MANRDDRESRELRAKSREPRVGNQERGISCPDHRVQEHSYTGSMSSALSSGLLELFQQVNRQTWLPFVGTSMIPRIREGNLLLVQHALRHIRLGDVIVFKRAESLTAHRVVLIRKHGGKIIYQTKGDNARSFDVPVDQSSVLGRVVCIRNADGAQISLERPYARFLNFALAGSSYAAGILYEFVVSVLKHNAFDF